MQITESTGNVFADLGLPDAEAMLRKATLVVRISERLQSTLPKAAYPGINFSHIEAWQKGHFRDVTEEEILLCLKGLEEAAQ